MDTFAHGQTAVLGELNIGPDTHGHDQQIAGQFFQTLSEYPPSQTPGSFNLDKVQEQIENAARVVAKADLIIIVGTSMQVYPAAGLVGYADDSVPVIYVDPKPSINYELERRGNIHTIEMGGSAGMEVAREMVRGLLG